MNSDRRSFFKTLGTAAVAAVAVPGITHEAVGAVAPPSDGRSFNVQRSLLEIAGTQVGNLSSVNGGYPVGVVVDEGPDEGGVVRKHIGRVDYKDLEFSGGSGMGPKFYKLIQDFLGRDPSAFDGSVTYSDAKFREGGRLDFTQALVHSVRFPTMDARFSKVPGVFGITCSLGSSQRVKGDGSVTPIGDVGKKTKTWLTGNFRLFIDGLDDAMARTSKIEGFEVKQEVLPPVMARTEFVDVGPLQVPDLVVTTSELRSEPLYQWFDNMVERGLPDERNGRIELLSADMKTVLFTIYLYNLGIWWLATEDGDESILKRVTAKMYCERMEFFVGEGTA